MMKPILQDNPTPSAARGCGIAGSVSSRASAAHVSEPSGVRQAKWLRPATAERISPPHPPHPLRIDAALANVTPLLTPVPSRPSKNAQPDAATGPHPFMKSPSSPVTLRRPRHDPAAVASQAPPRPPKPSPLPARTLGDASLIYAQIDHEALPTFRSTGITFVPYDKTVYAAALHSPAPLITDAHKALDKRVHSWIDFSVERKKHAAFEALTSRVKQLVGDKVIPCRFAPPADV